MNDLMNEAFT